MCGPRLRMKAATSCACPRVSGCMLTQHIDPQHSSVCCMCATATHSLYTTNQHATPDGTCLHVPTAVQGRACVHMSPSRPSHPGHRCAVQQAHSDLWTNNQSQSSAHGLSCGWSLLAVLVQGQMRGGLSWMREWRWMRPSCRAVSVT